MCATHHSQGCKPGALRWHLAGLAQAWCWDQIPPDTTHAPGAASRGSCYFHHRQNHPPPLGPNPQTWNFVHMPPMPGAHKCSKRDWILFYPSLNSNTCSQRTSTTKHLLWTEPFTVRIQKYEDVLDVLDISPFFQMVQLVFRMPLFLSSLHRWHISQSSSMAASQDGDQDFLTLLMHEPHRMVKTQKERIHMDTWWYMRIIKW
jgi:hypothetical protein